MNRTMVRSIRAHLMAASIVATGIDAVVVVLMFVFGVDESTFETTGFRIAVVAAIVIATALTRLFALVAYRLALRERGSDAIKGEARHVHPGCRFRALVSLHLCFAGATTNRGAAERRFI
ncbi:conserved hypothetical protein (plasmid) [Paraburkholderia phymatum STM815]|uniref:Uncharacterized protein n=2 Tax=Paraburkholderia phymatum TaxID=148447 RepID=B2JU30_PARP8|nr:conserved hypothetical protein [Paraburkholderia phymatum STM815]